MISIKIKGNLQKEIDALVAAEKKKKMLGMVAALKGATPVDTGEARDGWRVEGDAIVNDVDHISELNDGSSQQAPSFFIETTLLSQQGVSPSGIIVRQK